jgi:ubiquinone biosynthesis protein
MATRPATRRAAVEPDKPPASLLGRYREVAAVLVRHGLADVVSAMHLGPYLAFGTRLLPRRVRVDPTLSRPAQFRLTLEDLGPTFVKFGQALSVRADVVPPELGAELSKLQDSAAPLPAGTAEAAIEAALGQPVDQLFRVFDPTPLAAASMAQVHRAELLTGEQVVVKVRRPGIGRVIAGDIEILRHLARLVEKHVPAASAVDPSALVEEFAHTIRAEQDFAREGRNIDRSAQNFAGDPTVRFPAVVWPLTTASVLTLEYLDGMKVSEFIASGAAPDERRLIAQRGADAMLAQILVHGLFHADPHPGNLLVLPGGVVAFLDFGIVGRVDERLRTGLAKIVRAVWKRDADRLAALAVEIARPRGDVDAAALSHDLSLLLEMYVDVPLGELSMTDVLTEVIGTAARHQLTIPSNLMLLIKAIMTIEGVGRQLDPQFRIVEYAGPLAERLWHAESSPAAVAARATDALRESVGAMQQMPLHLDAIGRKIRDGRLEVQFVHRNLDHFVREMDRSSNRLSFAIVIGSLIVGSSLVIQAGVGGTVGGYPALGLAGFVVAGILGIGLAVGVVRSGRL